MFCIKTNPQTKKKIKEPKKLLKIHCPRRHFSIMKLLSKLLVN